MVAREGVAVVLASQVDGGNGCGGPLGEGEVDNVVAEEAVAADDDDTAEIAAFRHFLEVRGLEDWG